MKPFENQGWSKTKSANIYTCKTSPNVGTSSWRLKEIHLEGSRLLNLTGSFPVQVRCSFTGDACTELSKGNHALMYFYPAFA
jgi:hypothetical protein